MVSRGAVPGGGREEVSFSGSCSFTWSFCFGVLAVPGIKNHLLFVFLSNLLLRSVMGLLWLNVALDLETLEEGV